MCGLITHQTIYCTSKIPDLSDLTYSELKGAKVKKVTKSRSELLIVLTPRVVRTVEDARNLSIEERDKSHITPEMKQNPFMERLRLVPEPKEEEVPMETTQPLPITYSLPGPASPEAG